MNRFFTFVLLSGGVVLAAGSDAARGQLPADRWVKYYYHQTPTDPNSVVVFTVELSLRAVSSSGQSVAWQIERARFEKPADGQNPRKAWSIDDPDVDTSDGLWWITHDDPQAPQTDEFVMPPHMTGTAPSTQSGNPALEYDMVGVPFSSPPGPYAVTSSTDHRFQEEGEGEPIEEGDDEPVETDDREDL